MKRRTITIGLFTILVIILITSTELLENIWELTTGNGYIIPAESSIFTFNATKMNEGSGEWWLYGEDSKYYYTMEKWESNKPYFKILKEEAKKIISFNKHNYKTWQL